ncbi:MAG: hypothetical protein EPN22_14255 [Nitrospirae bacterium]|nr:MAG: hypothetical protein EPN22_14255 [Nitrospirota bacterium]
MKRIFDTFSSWMNAVTFAEAGEFETARQMMPTPKKGNNQLTWFDRIFMSVTFAEAGLPEEAVEIMNLKPVKNYGSSDFLETIGLKGIRITYGTMPIEAIL